MRRRWRVSFGLGLAAILLMLSGCPSLSQLTTATPVGAGKNMIAFAPSAYGFGIAALGSTDTTFASESGLLVGGVIDAMYRRGFTDRVDMGIQISGWGNVMVDGKINLLNSSVIALSIDPGIGGFFAGVGSVGAGYLQFNAPLLIDLKLGKSVTIALAAKYIGLYLFAGESTSSTVAKKYISLVGGNIALELRVTRVFYLMPHGGVFFWHNNPTVSSGGASASIAAAWFTGGLAFKFKF